MALYSCTLYIGAGANMTFINNSVIEKGGAMYIEPNLSPFVYSLYSRHNDSLVCFYRLLDCPKRQSYNEQLCFIWRR